MSKAAFPATEANFEADVLQSSLPVLVDFGADWCPPCKMIAPIVDELARKYAGKLKVAAVDADADPGIVMRYHVQGLPTLILFHNGQPVERIVGYTPRERLEAKLLPHLQPQQA